MPETTEPLTEAQVDEYEKRRYAAVRSYHSGDDVNWFLTVAIPALIRDWRAMKAQLEAATEYGDKLARNYTSLEDVVFRVRVALGATAGEFNPEQSIAALRKQLAQETERADRWETRAAQLGREVEDLQSLTLEQEQK